MGEFFCKDCGKQVQPTPNYKTKDGVIEASVTTCPYCGSKKISYDTK